MNRSIALGWVISKDTIERKTSDCLSIMRVGREESQQLNSILIQQGTITEDTPVALRADNKPYPVLPTSLDDGEGDLF